MVIKAQLVRNKKLHAENKNRTILMLRGQTVTSKHCLVMVLTGGGSWWRSVYLVTRRVSLHRILGRQQAATYENTHHDNVAKNTVVNDVEAEDAEPVRRRETRRPYRHLHIRRS